MEKGLLKYISGQLEIEPTLAYYKVDKLFVHACSLEKIIVPKKKKLLIHLSIHTISTCSCPFHSVWMADNFNIILEQQHFSNICHRGSQFDQSGVLIF